jgi:hypothetical protein
VFIIYISQGSFSEPESTYTDQGAGMPVPVQISQPETVSCKSFLLKRLIIN